MEIDSFPLASSPDLALGNALAILKENMRSAIVVAEDASYSMVTAADIVIANAEQSAATLGGIRDRLQLITFPYRTLPLLAFPHGVFTRAVLDFRDPALARLLEQYLHKRKARFAILGLSFSRALLVSVSESDMHPLQASPKDCYCKADGKAVSPGVHLGDCPHDLSHKGTVRCW